MKSLAYANPVDSDEALFARIAVVVGDIRKMPGVLANVRQPLCRRCEACIFAGGRSFDQFLGFRKKILGVRVILMSHNKATQDLLEMDLAISSLGLAMHPPELVLPLLTTIPHQWEDFELYRFNIHWPPLHTAGLDGDQDSELATRRPRVHDHNYFQ
ncbi:hypothetical protein TNCV_530041 [Trichonephila clavipes]|nr:hypothetical protein TNCV_530041 [Trichonephila clavipes]